jgi:hypothetical protein
LVALLDEYHMSLSQFSDQVKRLRDARALKGANGGDITAEAGQTKLKMEAWELAEDVRSGMDFVNLATKYDISERQMRQLIDRLAGTRSLESEVADRTVPFDMRISFPEPSEKKA